MRKKKEEEKRERRVDGELDFLLASCCYHAEGTSHENAMDFFF